MIKLRSLITEAKSEKVYMLNGMLWLSYSPDSGQTTRVRGRGWITDKSGDKNLVLVQKTILLKHLKSGCNEKTNRYIKRSWN